MNKRTTPIPPEMLAKMRAVTGKRPRVLLDLLEKQEFVTTEQLKELGYTHPPRVAGDVRDHGIPIPMIRVADSNGRSIGAYTLGDAKKIRNSMGGRMAFSKAFRNELLEYYGARSTLTGAVWPERALQIDHRIPFQVGGDSPERVEHYMLLDASNQRAKSFTCENCPNFLGAKDSGICKTCYWAFPEKYDHIATEQRRVVLVEWTGKDVEQYDKLKTEAKNAKRSVQDQIKAKLS